jgi:hypothetical protein
VALRSLSTIATRVAMATTQGRRRARPVPGTPRARNPELHMTKPFSLDLLGMSGTLHSMHRMHMISLYHLGETELCGMYAQSIRLATILGMHRVWTRTHAVHMTHPFGSFVGAETLHLGQITDFLRKGSRRWRERHEGPAHTRRVV